MSIKFSCPKCKHPLSVDDKLAGKAAKCPKCAMPVRIPTPKTQAVVSSSNSAVVSPPALGSALSELTDSDFNRQSPFESVYAPPKAQHISSEVLRRAASKDGREPAKKSTGLPAVLVFYAVLNLFQGISGLALTAILLAAASVLGDAIDRIPMLAAGVVTGAVLYGLFAVIAFLTGIGLLTKRLWGYLVANAAYTFYAVTNIFHVIGMRSDRNQMIFAAIGLVVSLLFASYFFRRRCWEFYKIKSWKLPVISSAVGGVVGLIVGGTLLGVGVYAAK